VIDEEMASYIVDRRIEKAFLVRRWPIARTLTRSKRHSDIALCQLSVRWLY
jgi:hypothetical protein